MEALCGATFDGHLDPPDGQKCVVQYKFEDALLPEPMPPKVQSQRRALGWPVRNGVSCVLAQCSIPQLGMTNEEVVVSSDPVAKDGSCRLLLQSLKRPELGLTVLRFESGGTELIGGDETWEHGETPIIKMQRRIASPRKSRPVSKPKNSNSSSVTRRAQFDETKPEPVPEKPAAKRSSQGSRGPARKAPTPPQSPPGSPTPDRGLLGPIEGGIASFGMGERRQKPVQLRASEASLLRRPDLVTGDASKPTKDIRAGRAETQAEFEAAKAEGEERLVSAAAFGEIGDMKLLITQHGPDRPAPEGRYAGLTPLMAAAQKGREEAIEFLLEKAACLEITDPKGWTPLMHAVQEQRPGVVRQLLQAKAMVNWAAPSPEQVTALMLAAGRPRAEICNALLKAGCNKEAADEQGRRAMHFAAKRGIGGNLVALLSVRAQANAQDSDGCTPLMLAAAAGRADSVKLLLASRADPSVQDHQGHCAAVLAETFEHDRVLRVLAGAGG